MNEQIEFDLDKSSLVVQSNHLAMANYDMTMLEQKVFLIILSTIKKDTTCIQPISVRIIDLANILDVSTQLLYRDIKKVCRSIVGKIVEIQKEDGSWDIFNIVKKASYKSKLGLVTFTIHEDAEPYLLQLKKLFLTFKIENILHMDCKYAIRLYQQAKSNLYRKQYIMSLEDFKAKLKLTQKSYNTYSNIKLKILTPSIKEINQKTDIKISVEEIKLGRKVHSLRFKVEKVENNHLFASKQTNSKTYSSKKTKAKTNKFNNFPPRNYDYDKLENALLYGLEGDEQEFMNDVTK